MNRRSSSSLGIVLVLVGCGTAFNFEYGLRGQNSFLKPRPRGNLMNFFGNMFQQHTQNDRHHWPYDNQNQEVTHWGMYQRPFQQPDYERHFYNFGAQQNDACSDEELDYSSFDVSCQDSNIPDNYPYEEEEDKAVSCNDDDKGIRWKGSQPEHANIEIEEVLSGGGQSQWGPSGGGYEYEQTPQVTPNVNGLNVEIHNCFPQGKTKATIDSSQTAGNEFFVFVIKKDHILGDAKNTNTTAMSIDGIIGATLESRNRTLSSNDASDIVIESQSKADSRPTTQSSSSKEVPDKGISQSVNTFKNPEIIIASTTPADNLNPTKIPLISTTTLDEVGAVYQSPQTLKNQGTVTSSTPAFTTLVSKLNPTKIPLSSTTTAVVGLRSGLDEEGAVSKSPEMNEIPEIIIASTTTADNSQQKFNPKKIPPTTTATPFVATKSRSDEDAPTKISLIGKPNVSKVAYIPIVNTPIPAAMSTSLISTTTIPPPRKNFQDIIPPLSQPKPIVTHAVESANSQSEKPGADQVALVTPDNRTQYPDLPSNTSPNERNQEVIVNYPTSTDATNIAVANWNLQTTDIPGRSSNKDETFKFNQIPSIVNNANLRPTNLISNQSSDTGKTKSSEEDSAAVSMTKGDQQSNTIANDKLSAVQRPQVQSSQDSKQVLDAVLGLSAVVVNANPNSFHVSASSDIMQSINQSNPTKNNTMTDVKVDPQIMIVTETASTTTESKPTSSGTNISKDSTATEGKVISSSEGALSASAVPQLKSPTIVNDVPFAVANPDTNAASALNNGPQAIDQVKPSQDDKTAGFVAKMRPMLITEVIVNKEPNIVMKPQKNTSNGSASREQKTKLTEEGVLSDSANLEPTTFTISNGSSRPSSTFLGSNDKGHPVQSAGKTKEGTIRHYGTGNNSILETPTIVNTVFPVSTSLQVTTQSNESTFTAVKTTPSGEDAFAPISETPSVNDLSSKIDPKSLTSDSRELISSMQAKGIFKPVQNPTRKFKTSRINPHSRTATILNDMTLKSQPTSTIDLNPEKNSVTVVGAAKSSEGYTPVPTSNTNPQSKTKTIVTGTSSVVSNSNAPLEVKHREGDSTITFDSGAESQSKMPTPINDMTLSFSLTAGRDSTLTTRKPMTTVFNPRPDSDKSNDSQLLVLESASLTRGSSIENKSKPATSKEMLRNKLIESGTNDNDSNFVAAVPDSGDLNSNVNLPTNGERNPMNSTVTSTSKSTFGDSDGRFSTASQLGNFAGHNIHELGHAIKGLHELVNKLMSTVNSTNIGYSVNDKESPEAIPNNVNNPHLSEQPSEGGRSATVNKSKSNEKGSVTVSTEVQKDNNSTSFVSKHSPRMKEDDFKSEGPTSFIAAHSQSTDGNKGSFANNSVASTMDSNSAVSVNSQSAKSIKNSSSIEDDDAQNYSPSMTGDTNSKTEVNLSQTAFTVNDGKDKTSSVSASDTREQINLESSTSNRLEILVTVTETENEEFTTTDPSAPSLLLMTHDQPENSNQTSSKINDDGNIEISSKSSSLEDTRTTIDAESVDSSDNSTSDTYDASSFTSTFDPDPSSTERPKKSKSENSAYGKILRLITWLRGKKDANEDETGNGATQLTESVFDPFEEIVEHSDNGVPVIDKDILPENLASWFLGFRSVEDDESFFTSMANKSQSSEIPNTSSEFTDLYHSFLEAAIHNVNNVSSIVNASEPIGTPLSWWSSYREADKAQNDTETNDVKSVESGSMEAAIHRVNNESSTVSDSSSTWGRWWSKLKDYKNLLRRAPITNESMATINFETTSQSGDLNQNSIVGGKHKVADANIEPSQRRSGWLSSFWETNKPHQNISSSTIVNDKPSVETVSNLTNDKSLGSTYIWSSSNGTSFDSNFTIGDVESSNAGEFYQFSTVNTTLANEEDGENVQITFSQPKSEWLSLLAQFQKAENASVSAVNETKPTSDVTVVPAKPHTYSHFQASDFETWDLEDFGK